MILSASVSPGNTLTIKSGADLNTIWLSPGVVDFERRLNVRVNGRSKWNAFVRPELETILEDFRVRADRQKIYWATLDF